MKLLAEAGIDTSALQQDPGATTTVKTHRGHLYKKLMVDNDVQLARYAFTHGYACVHPPAKGA